MTFSTGTERINHDVLGLAQNARPFVWASKGTNREKATWRTVLPPKFEAHLNGSDSLLWDRKDFVRERALSSIELSGGLGPQLC